RLPGGIGYPTPGDSRVSLAPGAQSATQPASPPMPASPKQVQPSPGLAASTLRACAAAAGSTRKKIAWRTIAVFCGMNWLPVRYAMLVSFGSTRKQRYSSVPPLGAVGVYGCGTASVTNRSPARSGAATGTAVDSWPACSDG